MGEEKKYDALLDGGGIIPLSVSSLVSLLLACPVLVFRRTMRKSERRQGVGHHLSLMSLAH